MAINKSEKIFCKFCKQILSDDHEKDLQYHVVCEQQVQEFNVRKLQALEKIKFAFGIDSLETENEAFPEHGICKYKFINQGENFEVFFRNYALKSVSTTIDSLSHLEKLSIRYSPDDYYDRATVPHQLSSLADQFCILSNLRHLDLTECKLKKLPDCFGDLINLETVTLNKNLLNDLPRSFKNLQNLLTLDLSSNELVNVSNDIFELKNLCNLNLKGNNITSVPDSFGNLDNLSTLDLGSNELTSLPITTWDLKNLRNLFLDQNNLKFLPKAIGNLTKLQVLNLDGNNKLQLLPKSIVKLISLQKIFLGGTSIVDFPKTMSALVNLNTIGLSYKQTVGFSTFAKDLPNLKKVIIYPIAYRNFGWDRWLHKYHYPPFEKLSKLPTESVQKCFEELRNNGCKIHMLSDKYETNSW